MELRTSPPLSTYEQLDSSVSSTTYLSANAISWRAIFAGAVAAAAVSLILLVLGTGLGFSVISPWAQEGVGGTTFGVSTILWITITSLIASGLGGYIAGRLRTRWIATQPDEIHFRDTAHGFLAWAIATLATATLLTSVIASIANGVTQTSVAMIGGAATATATTATNTTKDNTDEGKLLPYYLDYVFRKSVTSSPTANATTTPINPTAPSVTTPATATNTYMGERNSMMAKTEISRIFINALAMGQLPNVDADYAGQLLSQQINISQEEAINRITAAFNTMQTKIREAKTAAKIAADKARKATAYASLWLFISLLAGAFFASFTAIYGGRQRDL